MENDPRLNEAKAIPIVEVVAALQIDWLRAASHEYVGACPVCGGHEKRDADRFSINPISGVFNCRKCGVGGDGIRLVEFVKGCDFKAALSFLAGDANVEISPEERARRKALAEKRRVQQSRAQDDFRRKAFDRSRKIWNYSTAGQDTIVSRYLEHRGVDRSALSPWPKSLRVNPSLRYYLPRHGKPPELVMTGPAMVAAIVGPDGRGIGAHCTWLDLDQPKGKALIRRDDEVLDSKKVQGSHKGGAIRLRTPDSFDTLVMGEGIETTMTALAANVVPGAAYWAGVTLGNFAGKRLKEEGVAKKFSATPDMDDDRAFIPPKNVRRLILIEDGDSDPRATRAQLMACAQRSLNLNPDIQVEIVNPGEGVDLNDLAMAERQGR